MRSDGEGEREGGRGDRGHAQNWLEVAGREGGRSEERKSDGGQRKSADQHRGAHRGQNVKAQGQLPKHGSQDEGRGAGVDGAGELRSGLHARRPDQPKECVHDADCGRGQAWQGAGFLDGAQHVRTGNAQQSFAEHRKKIPRLSGRFCHDRGRGKRRRFNLPGRSRPVFGERTLKSIDTPLQRFDVLFHRAHAFSKPFDFVGKIVHGAHPILRRSPKLSRLPQPGAGFSRTTEAAA